MISSTGPKVLNAVKELNDIFQFKNPSIGTRQLEVRRNEDFNAFFLWRWTPFQIFFHSQHRDNSVFGGDRFSQHNARRSRELI